MDEYEKFVNERAEEMRAKPTKAERQFLKWVRKNYTSTPLNQYPIKVKNHYYILDFFWKNLYIAIEIDGSIHKTQKEKDSIRDKELLEEHGIYTIRLTNKQCKPCTLNRIFDGKFNEARNILAQTGNSIEKPKRSKTKGKQSRKNTLQDKELESIIKWAERRTNKPKNELKQFAQNIIKKKKELSFWYS